MSEHQDLVALVDCDPGALLAQITANRSAPGLVTFVGTGIGGPLQLTLASVKAIAEADVIIVGAGLDAALLDEPELQVDPDAAILQADTDPDLGVVARLATGGLAVVWLLAGDPLADGVGGPLAAELGARGCRIDMVPGLSMAMLALTSTGISVSADGLLVRNHLEQGPGTLITLTATDRIDEVAEDAARAGLPADAPAVLAMNYGSSSQQSIDTTLTGLAKAVPAGDPQAAAVIIGAAAHRDPALNWLESKPLFGWKVLVPRTKGLSGAMERRLEQHGAIPVQVPTISVEPPRNPQPMERAIQGLVDGRYQWIIFNSANAVRAVTERLAGFGLDSRAFSGLRIAAVGVHTVEALRSWGITPDLIPEGEQRSEALAAEFPVFDDMLDPINRIFIPRADIAVDALVNSMNELGWDVEDVVAYRTVRAAPPPAEIRESIKAGRFDAAVFSSASTVRNMVGIAGKPHADTIIAAIGPATVATCEEHGLRIDVVPERSGMIELVDALAEFATARRAALIAEGKPVRRPSQRTGRRRK